MNKLEKFLLATGVIIFAFAVIAGIAGWLMNSEYLFNVGCSFMFFILPAYFFAALILWGLSLLIIKK